MTNNPKLYDYSEWQCKRGFLPSTLPYMVLLLGLRLERAHPWMIYPIPIRAMNSQLIIMFCGPNRLLSKYVTDSTSILLVNLASKIHVTGYLVSVWSASYSLKKNQGSGGGVTSFKDQVQTCTGSVHVD